MKKITNYKPELCMKLKTDAKVRRFLFLSKKIA